MCEEFYSDTLSEIYMSQNIFYVYELVDPRINQPFYVGKGVGDRINVYNQKYPKVNEHTRTLIEEIALSGHSLEIRYVSESLSETDALEIETFLIKQYGRKIKDPGGKLTNLRSSDHSRVHKTHTGNKYTTIQVTKDMNERIKKYCRDKGIISATITEKLWDKYMSGSLTV